LTDLLSGSLRRDCEYEKEDSDGHFHVRTSGAAKFQGCASGQRLAEGQIACC
jgi:hypothetical protein